MKTAFKERRRLPRIKRRARVSFVVDNAKHDGLIVNFSEMGLYILSNVQPPLGSEISIPLDIQKGKQLEIIGRVVWGKTNTQSTDPYDYGFGVDLHATPSEYIAFVIQMYEHLSRRSKVSSERFDVYHKVRFKSQDDFLVEYMQNLSRGGMYLATKAPIEPGTTIHADIEIDGIGEPIKIEGKVSYRLDDDDAYRVGRTEGVGIQFVNLDEKAKAKLHHYIKRLEVHRLNPKRRRVEHIPLQGSLTEFLVPEILIHLYHTRATGILLLEKQNIKKLIYLKHGQPVYVESNLNNETLGRYLVRQGVITSQDLEDSLEELAQGDAHHGEIMIRGGMINHATLMEALVGHQEEKIMNTFLWFDGTYTFEATQDWPKTISVLPLRPYSILFHGISTWYDPNLLHAWMGLSEKTKIHLSAYENITFELPDLAKKAMLHMYSPVDLKTLAQTMDMEFKDIVAWVFGFVICGWVHLDFSGGEEKASPAVPLAKEPQASKGEALSVLHRWLNEDFMRLRNLNYFELFEVSQESSERELTKAYMKLMSRYSSKEIADIEDEEFKKKTAVILSWIQLGYDTLKDPDLRQMYLSGKKPIKNSEEKLARIEVERLLLSSVRELEKGRVPEALKQLSDGVRKYPHYPHLVGYLGWTQFLHDPKINYATSLEDLKSALQADPSDAHLHYFLGELYVYVSAWAKAEHCFVNAVKLFPKFLKAQAALELVREKQGL